MEDYSSIYREFAQKNEDFQRAFEIVSANSSGSSWLIGGAVYKFACCKKTSLL